MNGKYIGEVNDKKMVRQVGIVGIERIGAMCRYEKGNRCEEWVSLGGMRDRR